MLAFAEWVFRPLFGISPFWQIGGTKSNISLAYVDAMLTKRQKHWHGDDWEGIRHTWNNLERRTYFYDYMLLLLLCDLSVGKQQHGYLWWSGLNVLWPHQRTTKNWRYPDQEFNFLLPLDSFADVAWNFCVQKPFQNGLRSTDKSPIVWRSGYFRHSVTACEFAKAMSKWKDINTDKWLEPRKRGNTWVAAIFTTSDLVFHA